MTRHSKIARLPRAVRDELNRRLEDGEPGKRLVAWLNAQPAVQAVLAQHFPGRPINEPNLSAWKSGGFRAWQIHQELLQQARLTAEDAADLANTGGPLADHLATLLAARYAAALADWDGQPGSPATQQLRLLGTLRQDIATLCRNAHHAARIRLEQERFNFEYQQAVAKLGEKLDFQKRKLAMINRVRAKIESEDKGPGETRPPKSAAAASLPRTELG